MKTKTEKAVLASKAPKKTKGKAAAGTGRTDVFRPLSPEEQKKEAERREAAELRVEPLGMYPKSVREEATRAAAELRRILRSKAVVNLRRRGIRVDESSIEAEIQNIPWQLRQWVPAKRAKLIPALYDYPDFHPASQLVPTYPFRYTMHLETRVLVKETQDITTGELIQEEIGTLPDGWTFGRAGWRTPDGIVLKEPYCTAQRSSAACGRIILAYIDQLYAHGMPGDERLDPDYVAGLEADGLDSSPLNSGRIARDIFPGVTPGTIRSRLLEWRKKKGL